MSDIEYSELRLRIASLWEAMQGRPLTKSEAALYEYLMELYRIERSRRFAELDK